QRLGLLVRRQAPACGQRCGYPHTLTRSLQNGEVRVRGDGLSWPCPSTWSLSHQGGREIGERPLNPILPHAIAHGIAAEPQQVRCSHHITPTLDECLPNARGLILRLTVSLGSSLPHWRSIERLSQAQPLDAGGIEDHLRM